MVKRTAGISTDLFAVYDKEHVSVSLEFMYLDEQQVYEIEISESGMP